MLHPATLYSLVPLNHAPCFYSPLCAPGSFPAEFPNLSTTRLFGSNFSGCPAPIQPDTVAGHQRSAACVGHPDHCLGRRLLDGLWLDRRAVAAQPDNGDDVEVLSFFEGASPPNFNYFNYPVVAPPPDRLAPISSHPRRGPKSKNSTSTHQSWWQYRVGCSLATLALHVPLPWWGVQCLSASSMLLVDVRRLRRLLHLMALCFVLGHPPSFNFSSHVALTLVYSPS